MQYRDFVCDRGRRGQGSNLNGRDTFGSSRYASVRKAGDIWFFPVFPLRRKTNCIRSLALSAQYHGRLGETADTIRVTAHGTSMGRRRRVDAWPVANLCRRLAYAMAIPSGRPRCDAPATRSNIWWRASSKATPTCWCKRKRAHDERHVRDILVSEPARALVTCKKLGTFSHVVTVICICYVR